MDGSRVDVLDEHRPLLGAVALPQLLAVAAVVGSKEERPVDIGRFESGERVRGKEEGEHEPDPEGANARSQ